VQLAIGSGFLGWKQPWQPTLGKRGGKGQAKWGSRTLRCHHAALDEFRCQPARSAITRAEQSLDISPWQLATKQDRFQHCAGSWRQPITPRFFIGPEQNAVTQRFRLNQPFHEGDLIETGLEEKLREPRERFFAQMATAIEVVPPPLIAIA
jgi:hypothetical protein